MTERIVLMGPLSPADVADLLTGEDRSVARSIPGYRGVPLTELVKAFVAMGIRVEVVTEAGEVEECLDLQGPRFRVLIAPKRERARDRARDLFRREREHLVALLERTEGDVVHAHWTYEFAWAALGSGRPVLVTAHDSPFTVLRYAHDAYTAVRALMAWIVRMRIRNLSAVSPYLAQRWRRQMLYRRPIAVIPNIAPTNGITKPRPISAAEIVAVGDAGPIKNVQALIDAFALLRAERREVKLSLVGRGLGPEDALSQRAKKRGLADGIEFRGYISRAAIAELLSRSTIFVHPSLEESFGVVIVEAMNAGLPVVAGARSGGVPWVLANGDAGILVDVKQPSEIARGVARLLDDKRGARAITEKARRHVADNFSSEAVTTAYLAEYDRVRRKRGSRA